MLAFNFGMKVVLILLFIYSAYNLVKSQVPIIDVSSIFQQDPIQKEKTLTQIVNSFEEFGVFVAVNHLISEAMLLDGIQSAYQLFSLPLISKLNASTKISQTGRINRGYLGFGIESGLLNSNFEPKEGYCYGHNLDRNPTNQMESFNVWPSELTQNEIETFENIYERKVDFAEELFFNLMKLIDPNVSRDFYDFSGGRDISLLRLFHYLSASSTSNQKPINQINSECIGSSAHTDWGLLTLISQQNLVGGLQFFYNNEWRDVPVIPGSIVVNSGDYLKLISRGRFHSPVHRVLCPQEGQERISFVLFYYPGYNAPMQVNHPEPFSSHQCDNDTCSLNSARIPNEEFNTLAVVDPSNQPDSGTNAHQHPEGLKFGDYILEKWKHVMRQY